jgi:hypothetical protein
MRRAVRWAILVAVLAAAGPAGADDSAQRDAEARFEEGLARVRAHDLEAALQSFRQATALMRKPAIVWNLALTEEKTNHPVDALAHFKEYLRQLPAADPDRPRAQKHIDGLNAATGHIEVAAPTGAAITVDKTQSLGATPLADPIDVAPGHHDVEAKLGAVVKTVAVEALAGQTMQADFRGMEAAAAGTPGATAPQAEGGGATPGEPPPPVPEQPSAYVSPTTRLVTVIALGGAAVIASGAGLAFGLESNSKASAASALRQQNPSCVGVTTGGCAQLASDTSAQQSDHTISTVLWVAGGALAAGAVGAFFLWPRAAAGGGAVSVVPAVGPGSAGLTAVGTF